MPVNGLHRKKIVLAQFGEKIARHSGPVDVVLLVSPEAPYFQDPETLKALGDLLNQEFLNTTVTVLITDTLQRFNYLPKGKKVEDCSEAEIKAATAKARKFAEIWQQKFLHFLGLNSYNIYKWDECLLVQSLATHLACIQAEQTVSVGQKTQLAMAIERTAENFSKAKFKKKAYSKDPVVEAFKSNSVHHYLREETAVMMAMNQMPWRSQDAAGQERPVYVVYPNKPTPTMVEASKRSKEVGNPLTWASVRFMKRDLGSAYDLIVEFFRAPGRGSSLEPQDLLGLLRVFFEPQDLLNLSIEILRETSAIPPAFHVGVPNALIFFDSENRLSQRGQAGPEI